MHIALKALSLMLACLLFAPGSACAADSTPEKPKPEASLKREAFRYDGKSFDEWRNSLQTELKPERRVEALKALRAFAVKGYAGEAAAAAIQVMADYAPGDFAGQGNEKSDVDLAAVRVLEKAEAAAQPALLHALQEGNQNQRYFALLWLKNKESSPGFALAAVEKLVPDRDSGIRELALDVLFSQYSEKEALAT